MSLALVFGWLAAAAGPPAAGAGFTVAIDAGHGGTNLGTSVKLASGQVVYEKRITMDLAWRVRRKLEGDPGIRVVLCRDGDVLVPIRARVRCANEAGARVFLSLHANASPEGPRRGSQRGFELYVLSAEDVDEDVVVAQLGQADDADAAWTAHRIRIAAEESAGVARRIESRLAESMGASADRGVKQSGASLDVLRGLMMPAVLVEVGFLDHAQEGPRLASPQGLDVVAGALAKAIVDLRLRDARGVTVMSAPLGPARTTPLAPR